MNTRVTAATAPTSRRYGAVNWIGLRTLVWREVQRFLKVGAQTIFAPLISTVLFMLVFSLTIGAQPWAGTTRPYQDGLAAGLIMMSIISNAFQNSSSSLMIAKVQGNAVDFLMPPLSAWELSAAFIIGAAARGVLVGAAGLIVVMPLANIVPAAPWAALYYALVASVMFGAMGLLAAIWADKFDHIAAVTNFIVVPLTFLSGTFYSIERLPEPFRTLSHYNPVFYLIDGFRFGFIGSHDAPLALGMGVSAAMALALCLGAWAVIKSGYRLKA